LQEELMTHPAIQSARDFVQQAELPEPPPINFDIAKAPFNLDPASDQAAVVGSDVVAFMKGVTREQRQDVMNATLLAQLVARKQIPTPESLEQIERWYDEYFDVLTKIGFQLTNRDFSEYHEHSGTFEAHQAILDVAAALLVGAPGALALVKTTLEALQKMSEDSPWITLFNRESHSANAARFQVSVVEQDDNGEVVLSVISFGLQAEHKVTQVLFFKFKKNDVRLQQHSGKVTINAPVLTAVRSQIADRLIAYSTDFIQGLPPL
jgi:hypothetical protein